MACLDLIKSISTTLTWTAAGASAGAALTGSTTALGAVVLYKSGHDDYSASQGAYIGLMGGALIGGALGFIFGLADAADFVAGRQVKIKWDNVKIPIDPSILGGTVAINVLGALTGHGVLASTGPASAALALGQTAAAAAVGSAILIPSALLIGCAAAAACWVTAQAHREPAGYLPVAQEAVAANRERLSAPEASV